MYITTCSCKAIRVTKQPDCPPSHMCVVLTLVSGDSGSVGLLRLREGDGE